MSSFTRPLTVTKLSTGLWEVARSFSYYVGKRGSKDVVHVPKGFTTDFASVPRLFWIILPPDGKYTQSAVLHDFGYFSQKRSRKEVDRMFLESMKVLGVPLWKRQTMYRAVRSFGWIPWKKKDAYGANKKKG